MQKATLQELVRILPDAALVLDADGTIYGANDLATHLLAIGRDDLLGSSASTLGPASDEPWFTTGTRQVFLGTTKVEVAVREVEVEGESLRLVTLREAPLIAFDQAVASWEIGILARNLNTDELQASPHARALLGLGELEPTRESVKNAIHPDDQQGFLRAINRASSPGTPGSGQFLVRVILSNGRTRFLQTRIRTEFAEVDGEQRPVRVVGALMDVTERQELSLALRHHQERLGFATVVTGVGLFDRVILPHGQEPYWSDSMRKLLGYDLEAPADPEWFAERVHEDDMSRFLEGVKAANAGDGRVELRLRWLHPNGAYRHLLLRSRTLVMQVGESSTTRSIGAVLDITEQSEGEDELRSRTAILDATPDFVGIADEAGNVLYLNRAARAFWGLDEFEPLAGRTLGTLHSSESLEQLQNVGMPAVRQHGVWSGESSFRRVDGVMVPMSQVILSHRRSSGETHFSTVARDLSKLKLLEEQYRQAQKMEAVGRLAGGIAHDFNNLLSVIMVGCELAVTGLEPEHGARQDIDEVLSAAERAAGLTRQLLAFGRKQILQPTVLDLNDVLTEMKPMLQRLVDESIEVHVLPLDRPSRIKADPTQVQQILLNLVVNARDAMPTGGVLTVEALQGTVEDDDAVKTLELSPGDYSILAVSDTGHGMTAETRQQIFEPFFTTKGPGQGTGLGLATVFGIVHQSGGAVWVYSEVGHGTTFKIYLPTSDEPVQAPTPPSPRLRSPQTGVILLAEDDDQLRKMVANTLLRAGYQVITTDSSAKVLQAAEAYEGHIDLLVTDVVMPGMSGKQLASRLHASRPTLTVLYMSGYTENTIVHHGVLDDDVNFLPKPITPGRLLAAIEDVLGRARAVEHAPRED